MPQNPRILVWDIETAPNQAYVWGHYQQDVIAYEHQWYLLCIAWKWLGEKKTHVVGLCDFEGYEEDPENDYELAAVAHSLFCEADIVVAHNGIAFDTRKAQARMLVHGFNPPKPFKEVDTLRVAKSHFAFNSNRLGDLCATLGIGGKADTGGFKTWLGCLQGDPKAWARMKKYNKHDVVILEQLYLKLRPWMPRHPNVAVLADKVDGCPKCGVQDNLIERGWLYAISTRRKRYQCKSCGGWCAGRPIERLDNEYV